MGADLTGTVDALRGLLIQDPRVDSTSLSTSLSTLTQAGPIPGQAVAQQDSEMVLDTTGTQTASKELRIRTVESGHPGTDSARFVWREDGDALWRGWDPPTAITSFEFIDRSTTAGYWKWPHAVVTSTGKIVAVAQREDRRIYAFTRSTAGVWASGVEVYDRGSSYTDRASPCLVLLPSGRLICLFWRERGTSASIWMYYSDDDGATWAVGSRAALDVAISTSTYTIQRLRAAYLDGQIILIAHLVDGFDEEIHQWASVDLGSSFATVDSLSADYGYPDVIAHNGQLVVAYLKDDATNIKPYIRRLGSAFEAISSAAEVLATSAANVMEWGISASSNFTEGDLALWADEDGSLYVLGLDHDAAGGAYKELMISRSADDGDTWHTLGDSSAGNGEGSAVWFGHDADTYPLDFCAVSVFGQAVVLHRFKADPGTADDSLCQMTLGGYTTVEIPELDALNLALANRAGWEMTWLPFDLPGGSGSYVWGTSTTGSPTVLLSSSGLHISQTAAQAVHYSVAPVTSNKEAILLVTMELKASGPDGYIQIRTTNGSNLDIDVKVVVTALGGITFSDVHGGTLGTVAAGGAVLVGIQLLLAASDPTTAKASAWYRKTGTDSDREWIAIATNQTCITGTISTGTVAWGTDTGTGGSTYWRLACTTWATYAGSGLSGGQSNPDDLLGRAYMPTAVYVDDGLSISAVDGPTFRSDVWNIDTRYTHGIDHIHTDVSPSPRRGWRSTDETAHELVWEVSTTVSDVSLFLEDIIGLHLGRVNWQTGAFWARNSSGTWVKLFNIDTAARQISLKFTRNGSTIIPDTTGGSDADLWWSFHALAGGYWDNGTEIRKIRTNTSGAWLTAATASTARAVRLVLDDYAIGDVSSGTDGAIWSRDVTVLRSLTAGVTYSAYKLQIHAQTTAEGYFTIGSVVFGPVLVFGGEYSWGRGLSLTTSIQRTTGRGGTRRSRQLAPARRAVEIGWPDGLDTTEIGQTVPAADYYRAYTGGPLVAGEGDALYSIRGLIEQLSETDGLVVYIPRYPIDSSAVTLTLNHRDRHLYGRVVTDTHRVDAVLGEEGIDEVLRGGKLRIEEEL